MMKEHIAKKKTWYFNTTVMDNLDDLKTLAEKIFFHNLQPLGKHWRILYPD